MELDATKKTSYTFELSNDQQELLLGLMVNGNFRKREVPYSLYSIEGEKFNATLYAKEKHGKRKLCVQGSGAQDFVEFQLVPTGVVSVEFGYEDVLQLLDGFSFLMIYGLPFLKNLFFICLLIL